MSFLSVLRSSYARGTASDVSSVERSIRKCFLPRRNGLQPSRNDRFVKHIRLRLWLALELFWDHENVIWKSGSFQKSGFLGISGSLTGNPGLLLLPENPDSQKNPDSEFEQQKKVGWKSGEKRLFPEYASEGEILFRPQTTVIYLWEGWSAQKFLWEQGFLTITHHMGPPCRKLCLLRCKLGSLETKV